MRAGVGAALVRRGTAISSTCVRVPYLGYASAWRQAGYARIGGSLQGFAFEHADLDAALRDVLVRELS
jgi:hypothetical protein